jgi:hypothetical protein
VVAKVRTILAVSKQAAQNLDVEKFNPLNAELNSICYLLALLGAQHFLHVSRIRVKSLILRLLTYLLTPWSRVLLEKLTSELCS